MFFFFKQKTAYEMRISDWSSDVCSSDLVRWRWILQEARNWTSAISAWYCSTACIGGRASAARIIGMGSRLPSIPATADSHRYCTGSMMPKRGAVGARSEEHTSELQSLMRISYAVFCLKKKNKTEQRNRHRQKT